MDWKGILKVSVISGVVTYFLWLLFAMFNIGRDNLYLPLIFAFIATGFILNRRLKKEDWGLLIGMVLASLVILMLHFLFFGLYLDFLFDLLPF